jgi:hypothetical protein
MLYRGIIAVCSDIHTKRVTTLCGQAAAHRLLDDKCQFLTISAKRTQDTEIKDGVKKM